MSKKKQQILVECKDIETRAILSYLVDKATDEDVDIGDWEEVKQEYIDEQECILSQEEELGLWTIDQEDMEAICRLAGVLK